MKNNIIIFGIILMLIFVVLIGCIQSNDSDNDGYNDDVDDLPLDPEIHEIITVDGTNWYGVEVFNDKNEIPHFVNLGDSYNFRFYVEKEAKYVGISLLLAYEDEKEIHTITNISYIVVKVFNYEEKIEYSYNEFFDDKQEVRIPITFINSGEWQVFVSYEIPEEDVILDPMPFFIKIFIYM